MMYIHMWDLTYVNNVASAEADFDLHIFTYIYLLQAQLGQNKTSTKRKATPL